MKTRWTCLIAGALVAGGWGITGAARAEEAPSLQDRLKTLEERQDILERKYENDQETAAAKATDAPGVTANPGDGFTLRNADKSFTLKIGGYLQTDGRFYLDDTAGAFADQFLLRRARLVVDGTVSKAVEFRLAPDFGGGTAALQDGYVNLKYTPGLQVRVGRFKVPFGLERLQASQQTLFIEPAHATSLTPNFDVGLQVHGEAGNGALAYALGGFNGAADGASADGDAADGKDLAARVFLLPFKPSGSLAWKELGVGVAATRGRALGLSTATVTGLPTFRTPGQQSFFSYLTGGTGVIADGDRLRWSPQLYWYPGRFGVLGEYVASRQEVRRVSAPLTKTTLTHRAWQVQASYVLTGETTSFKGLKPRRAFDPANHAWGAWELAARLSEFRADRASFDAAAPYAKASAAARRARTASGGVNGYLNNAVKVQINYDHTRFTGGAPGADRPLARELLTRVQVSF